MATWATVDSNGKIDGFGWNLPLTAVNNIAEAQFDSRLWMTVPDQLKNEAGFTGFAYDHLPHGHIPPGIYDVPHWEFHVIFQDFKEVQSIDCSDPTLPDSAIVPPPFSVLPPPDNCFSSMGIHAINLTSPEFNKQKFTYSSLLVYYRGNGSLKDKGTRLTSFEPKATDETFKQRKSFTFQMPTPPPGALGRPTQVPVAVTATYDSTNDTYIFKAGPLVPAT